MTRVVAAVFASLAAVLPAAGQPGDSPPLAIGAERPGISFHRLDGAEIPTWEELEGDLVVVDFWASWCQPCVAAFPDLNELQARFGGRGVRFLSVTYEPEAFVRSFLAEHPLRTTVALDPELASFASFNAWGIPVVYLFDRRGRLLTSLHPVHLTAELIEKALNGEPLEVEEARGWSDPTGAREYFASLRDALSAEEEP
ncbi:MAG: TlpA disulfide reductase family protein [Thermoanaerobaculia bacterium]